MKDYKKIIAIQISSNYNVDCNVFEIIYIYLYVVHTMHLEFV